MKRFLFLFIIFRVFSQDLTQDLSEDLIDYYWKIEVDNRLNQMFMKKFERIDYIYFYRKNKKIKTGVYKYFDESEKKINQNQKGLRIIGSFFMFFNDDFDLLLQSKEDCIFYARAYYIAANRQINDDPWLWTIKVKIEDNIKKLEFYSGSGWLGMDEKYEFSIYLRKKSERDNNYYNYLRYFYYN